MQTLAEPRYISGEQRAAWLIDKGVEAWQETQRLAMEEDDLVDSVVLLGQDLWLPHHETRGTAYRVTLKVAVHYPRRQPEACHERFTGFLRALEKELSDDRGALRVEVERR